MRRIAAVLFSMLLVSVLTESSPRVFELRTYTCYDGKLDALKANFRDHNIAILRRHGIESIGYWVPQDAEKSKNTLIFILAHPSMEAARTNWEAFRNDPEFKKVAADSEAAHGKIVSRVESVFMDPADFSPLR
jgi:hypothetical protein